MESAHELLKKSDAKIVSELPFTSLRRFTLREEFMSHFRSMKLINGGSSTSFQTEWIDLALFPLAVGLLILRVTVDPPNPSSPLTVGQLNDFLYNCHIIQPLRLDWKLATWRSTKENGIEFLAADLVDYLLQVVSAGGGKSEAKFVGEFFKYRAQNRGNGRRIQAVHYTHSPFGQTYGDTFEVYSYVALDGDQPVPGASKTPATQSSFDCVTERALYELTTLTDTGSEDFRPHPDCVKMWRDKRCLRLWNNWQGSFTNEHVVFLGLGNSRWTLQALPHNVGNDYFTLYLLAIFQKIGISFLFSEISSRHHRLHKNIAKVRSLLAEFIEFQSSYWITEVTRRAQGKLIYESFQKSLDVNATFENLRLGIRDLQEYYEDQVSRQTNYLLLFLTVVGLPLTIFTGMFSANWIWRLPDRLLRPFTTSFSQTSAVAQLSQASPSAKSIPFTQPTPVVEVSPVVDFDAAFWLLALVLFFLAGFLVGRSFLRGGRNQRKLDLAEH